MPATLPWPLFVRQLGYHILTTASRWTRYILVATVWLVALPWCIRQVWRGLFWLADGSWLPQTQRRARILNETSDTQDAALNSTDLATDGADGLIVSAFSSVMHFLAGESLAAKGLRILFSVPSSAVGPTDTDRPAGKPHPPSAQRQPSLLSNVKFIKSWTSSNFTTNLAIDVMEGLLICLCLVAGFVLVFLIREWVINQQPMLNDPDLAAERLGRIDEDMRVRRALRARPRRAGRGADLPDAIPPPEAETGPPARRRAMTEDNIGAPTAQNLERPIVPVRAQSLLVALPASPREDGASTSSDAVNADTDAPPPLLRGMVGEAVDARRALEEAMRLNVPESDIAAAATMLPTSSSSTEPQTLQADNNDSERVVAQLSTPPPGYPPAQPSPHQMDDSARTDEIEQLLSPSDDGNSPTRAQESDVDPTNFTPGPSDDTSDIGSTPGTPEEVTALGDHDPDSSRDAVMEDSEAGPEQRNAGQLDRLADFFWFVDEVPHPDLHQDLPNAEEADPPAEAPFVPMPNRAFAVLPDAAVEPLAHGVADPAPALDLNDQNALDDAEDFEGVLELIGMEGPFIGMVQNVVFSLLLISLTLAAAIWIPYIWGKIALILLANPVAVVFKAPLYLITSCVDLVADICFFLLGLTGILFNTVAKTVKATTEPVLPAYAKLLDTETFEQLAVNVTHQSGSRLEKTLRDAVTIFSPDLPTFSMQSHRALNTFKASLAGISSWLSDLFFQAYESAWPSTWTVSGSLNKISHALSKVPALPTYAARLVQDAAGGLRIAFRPQLKPLTLDTSSPQDVALVEWSTQDKIIAIALGYIFFAVAGLLFMKLAHWLLGLRKNEKVEGPLADRLREAGGVMKVIIIIGIEMIAFPLYCGLLFDLALLPLFESATVASRLAFIARAPFTGLFLHWFAGTCYMFHFALFVSMCRKILRKGVLYFIRDPDDPTFHPVRDVLERPVPTQLGKIAFSALVYGGLVIVCLGGVVWSVASVGNVLPIRWGAPEPRLAFPLDLICLNFMIPLLVRKMKPSEKVAVAYEWWFRGIAHGLRLSHFFFNEEREDEKRPIITNEILSWRRKSDQVAEPAQAEGIYVRAPASDSCRIPKNSKTFVEVTENNKRVDGAIDSRYGLHGRKNHLFAKIWLPPHFRARIATFVVLLWLFAAGTGIACTIGPLVAGRRLLKLMTGVEGHVNDLYALTLGIHLFSAVLFVSAYARPLWLWTIDKMKAFCVRPLQALPQVWQVLQYVAGMLYLALAFGIVFPFTLSLITELYIHVPIFTFLVDREKLIATSGSSDAQILSAATTLTESASVSVQTRSMPPIPPTVFILQTWTLGLLYLRLVLQVAMNYPCRHTRMSTAIQMITLDSIWRPKVWLATRAVLIPLTILCITLLVVPLGYARLVITLGRVSEPEDMTRIYRFAYPGLLGLVAMALAMWNMMNRLATWRSVVRDEVYLVGERLHNYASLTIDGRNTTKRQNTEVAPSSSTSTLGVEVEEESNVESVIAGSAVGENRLAHDW